MGPNSAISHSCVQAAPGWGGLSETHRSSPGGSHARVLRSQTPSERIYKHFPPQQLRARCHSAHFPEKGTVAQRRGLLKARVATARMRAKCPGRSAGSAPFPSSRGLSGLGNSLQPWSLNTNNEQALTPGLFRLDRFLHRSPFRDSLHPRIVCSFTQGPRQPLS